VWTTLSWLVAAGVDIGLVAVVVQEDSVLAQG